MQNNKKCKGKKMIVIGIYDDHNSSAALSIDGEIVCAVQEERFTKRKNEKGFPKNSVSYILNKYNLSNENIDLQDDLSKIINVKKSY